MSQLSDLPNVGKVLETALIDVNILTPDQLRAAGAEETFLRIRTHVDPDACLHMLYGIEGAILGIRDTLLPSDIKQKLKNFYKTL